MLNSFGEEVAECSRCQGVMLVCKYFSKNRQGEYFKTCDMCRAYYRRLYATKPKEEYERVKHHMLCKVQCDICGNEVSKGYLKKHQKTSVCKKIVLPPCHEEAETNSKDKQYTDENKQSAGAKARTATSSSSGE